MIGHISSGTELSTGRRSLTDLIAEYDAKHAAIPQAFDEFEKAGTALKSSASFGGTWGMKSIDVGRVFGRDLEKALLSAAWRHTYHLYDLNTFASAKDKDRLERMFTDPDPFTMTSLVQWFGDYVADPRGSILRGLAEVFADLDPAYKSHEKVKIGVKGLPKRVILDNVGSYGSWGEKRLQAILNALAAFQGKPLITHQEINALLDDGDILREDGEIENRLSRSDDDKTIPTIGRGVWLKRYGNGNGHLFFDAISLKAINMALAEYYGDVLADCPEERPAKRAGTAVAKDLQYYPTPVSVVARVVDGIYQIKGKKILEPQCGCGRFLDKLRDEHAQVLGIEVDAARAAQCRARGHNVVTANFLEMSPSEDFDHVVMNPPFYGKHYAKHVLHAMKFLKPGGTLTSILPITARYDHGLLDDLRPRWHDLPVGSFSESGTNINTTVATVRRAA